MKQYTIVISRKWSGPLITVGVEMVGSDAGVEVRMSLEEYIQAVAQEMGNPTFLLTGNQLYQALFAASNRVIDGMKAETARVM